MKSTCLGYWIATAALIATGCSNDAASTTDAGVDLGTADLGSTDLGTTDLGTTDLGTADLGTADLGTADLGGEIDEGITPIAVEIDCEGLAPAETVNASFTNGFVDATSVVDVDDIILFHNEDGFPHTVTAATSADGEPTASGAFDFDLPSSSNVCVRFLAEGTFPYFCEFHTSMRGSVAVGSF